MGLWLNSLGEWQLAIYQNIETESNHHSKQIVKWITYVKTFSIIILHQKDICFYKTIHSYKRCVKMHFIHLVGVQQIMISDKGEGTAFLSCHRQYWTPLGRNKGKIISFTFTGDEFTRSPAVAPRLSSRNIRNVFPSLSQSAPIELMFCGVWDKCTIIMWM